MQQPHALLHMELYYAWPSGLNIGMDSSYNPGAARENRVGCGTLLQFLGLVMLCGQTNV